MPIPLISKIKPENNGAFPMYDDVDGYGGFQVRANNADRDSIFTLNRKPGMLVYTQFENTFWQLEPDLTTWKIAPLGSSVVPNPSWFQDTWFIDPQNGDDTNDGLTSGTAIKTWFELVRRWGTYSPVLTVAVTVTFLTDQPDFTDPVFANPSYVGAGILTITGSLQLMMSGTLSGVVPKNYAATGAYPAGLLQTNLTVAADGYQGYLLVDSTRTATCWINSITSGVAVLTQPFTSNVPAYTDDPNEVDNFTNGDSFSIYQPTKVYISGLAVNSSSTDLANYNLSHIWAVDPNGLAGTLTAFSHGVRITEARLDVISSYILDTTFVNNTHINAWAPGGGLFLFCFIIGGSFGTLISLNTNCNFSGYVDADAIFRGPSIIFDVKALGLTGNEIGKTYFDNSQGTPGVNYVQVDGDTVFGSTDAYPGGAIYGQYTFILSDVSSKIVYTNGTAATTFRGTPTLQIDAESFANAYDRSKTPAVSYPARALTVVNLDKSVFDGGFGGLAIGDGGAIFTDGTQISSVSTNYSFFVDPANVSTLASDDNDGLSAITPFLTTNRLNYALHNVTLLADTTITYMSDDTGSIGLNFSSVNTGTFNFTFQGTPQVLHNGVTLAAGTVAINPATNQRQTAVTSDAINFTTYLFDTAHATNDASYVLINSGSNTGTSAWIAGAAGTDGYMSRPITTAIAAGAFTIGDSYKIQRGSQLNIAAQPIGPNQSGINFNDFAFGSGTFNVGLNNFSSFTRCSWRIEGAPSGTLNNCFVNGFFGNTSVTLLIAGVVSSSIGQTTTPITTWGDTYFTGGSLILSDQNLSSLQIYNSSVSGSFGSGIQVHDVSSALGAVQIVGNYDFSSFAGSPLIWGTGNIGVGISLSAGSSLTINSSNVPKITGVGGDFGFINSPQPLLARAWDEIANVYGLTAATTWANFANTGLLNFQAHNVESNACLIGTPRSAGPASASFRTPFGVVRFIDPSNVTGLASDSNTGADSTHPILTTTHLNGLFRNRHLTTDTTITYMSDDNSGTFLDISTFDSGTFNLFFQGTPQIVHTGGTLSTVTAINPILNQRQVMTLSDISDFTPYDGYLLVDTQSDANGTSAWIVSSAGVDGYFSRPATASSTFPLSGNFIAADPYIIQRGSNLLIANQTAYTGQLGAFFNDFTFGASNNGAVGCVYNRCSFASAVFTSGVYENCYLSQGISDSGTSNGTIGVDAGVLITGSGNNWQGLLTLSGDVYITGQGLFLGDQFYSNLYMVPSDGAVTGAGIQVFDCTGSDAAVHIQYTYEVLGGTLIWGVNPTLPGISIEPGATLRFGTTPIITGLYDFVFFTPGSALFTTVGRAWDETVGAYTEAGNPATRSTTWANFILPISSGGFGKQVHDPNTNAHMVEA